MEKVKAFLRSKDPVKWLFYGDSITHGALHTFGCRDYTELFSERLRFELGRPRDIVIKTAISGNNTRSLLADFEWRVAQFRPHVVFLMIGMNDCSSKNDITLEEFERNLHELADRVLAIGGRPVLQTSSPILPGTAPDRTPHFGSYMDAVRRVAADRALPLIDHTRFWLQSEAKLYYWMSDAFHPNNWGHMAFAELLYRELDIFDPASHSCRFYRP
jgi:lysophospholipase L1-like esterase